jgi:hypothetical protein
MPGIRPTTIASSSSGLWASATIDITITIAILDHRMKTVQMTLEPALVAAVDRAARRLKLSRSAFTRKALREALAREREQELDRRLRQGYARKPVRPGELDVWEGEQVWGDDEAW